jgi:hypothetical protein
MQPSIMAVYGSFLVHTIVRNDSDKCRQDSMSFLGAIQRRYIRNPNQQEFDDGKMLIFTGDQVQYDAQSFVPVEVKAGRHHFFVLLQLYVMM